MGNTSIWGYIALAAVVIGFAYGIWRQKTAPQRQAKRAAKRAQARQEMNERIDNAESEAPKD